MSWPNDTQSNTLEPYRFRLVSSLGRLDKMRPPLEWEEAELVFERILDKGGVFSVFNIDSLTFVNEAANLIKRNFDTNEINAECNLYVEWFNEDTQRYESFPTTYELNFKTYKIIKIEDFGIGVNIQATKNGLLQKLNNRADIDVDITKLESIGGYTVIDYTDLKKWVKMPQINSFLRGNYDESTGIRDDVSQTTLALSSISRSDFEGDLKLVSDGNAPSKTYSFLFESSRTRDLNISGSMDVEYQVFGVQSVVQLRIYKYDSSGIQISNELLEQEVLEGGGTTKNITWDKDFTLNEGESMLCSIGFSSISTVNDEFSWSNIDFNIVDTVLSTEETNIECFPLYEAIERNLQLVLDRQYPLYSDFFSRLDNKWNPFESYTTENQLRYAVYTSGTGIRGENLSNENNPLNLNFRDNFKTLQAIWNVGYGLESFIDNNDRIRIEEYSYFFKNDEILDFSDQLTRLDIETEVMPELCYVSVISGYENYEYESINGRDEYNTENKRTTVLNAEAEFDNKAPYRADTKGFADLLAQNINTTSSTDEKGDNDTFILKVQKNETLPAIDWDAEEQENIEVLENSSIYDFGGLNLYFTPTRNLNRSSNRWTSGLQKQVNSFVRFQTASKNQTLKTKGVAVGGDDAYIITENDNLQVGNIYTLNDPLFRPIKHTVEIKLTLNDIKTIQANPYGLYRLTSDISGWILKLSKKNNEDKAVLEIIEKYVA